MTSLSAGEAGRGQRFVGQLPRGRTLEDNVWNARHRGIVRLIWLHAVALPLLSLAYGDPLSHALLHGAALAGFALGANRLRGRLTQAVTASFGLLTASVLLVHITGGLTEAHFHFFVMISVVTLYEEWRTFLLAFAYVVLHHGVMGTVAPHAVFDHGDAALAPWWWASIHGGFVLAAGVANVIAWRANETATEQRTRAERHRADDAQLRLAALVEATDDAVIGKTADGTVTSWNGGAERLFGRSAQEMLGASIMAIVPAEHEDDELRLMAQVVADGHLDHYETTRVHADGRTIDVSLTLSLVRDPATGAAGLVGVARDISERKRVERDRQAEAERFELLALADHLTGLGNPRQFNESLDREIVGSARHGRPFALVMFDLDGFKGINDTGGHAEGDRVLRLFADLMREGGRGQDVACRVGGDEFALILPETSRDGAVVVAERIRTRLRGERDDADVSFGVAMWPQNGTSKEALIAFADTGMYAAKALQPTAPRGGAQVTPNAERPEVDARAAIQRLLDMARRHLGMDIAVLGEFEAGDEVVRGVAGDAEAFGFSVGGRAPLEDTYCQRMTDGRLTNIVHDAAGDERVRLLSATGGAGIGSYIGVPLNLPGGEPYGVLCCMAKDPQHALDQRDVSFLRVLAGIAGEQLERSRIETIAERLRHESTGIDALLSALEARDSYTGLHSETVVCLAERVGRRLGLDDAQIVEVRQAALLHDVGKIGIPDAILRKAGPLSTEEWVAMRRHPEIGAEIVGGVPTLVHLTDAVRAEHERWDGGGYPHGLAGEAIPLASRITFACDAYDAMTTDRPYRAAMPEADAQAELAANAGSQFDPKVVAALLAVLDEPDLRQPAPLAATGCATRSR